MTNVIMFGAESFCTSCVKLHPVFNEVAKLYPDIEFKYVDVESDEGVDLSCEYTVRNVPTILVFKDGEVVERIAGTRTKDELKNIIEKWK